MRIGVEISRSGRYLLYLCLVSLVLWRRTEAETELVETIAFDRSHANQMTDPLNAVLSAMDRALQFLLRHVNQVNLDAIIGPRQVEGVTNALLARYWENMPEHIVKRLMQIRQLANKVGNIGDRVVQQTTPYYYSRTYHLIQPYSWSLYRSPDSLNYSMPWFSQDKTDAWEEEASDNCLHEFLNKTETGKCAISQGCWRIVTSDRQTGYSLVHQLIYMLSGMNSGCLGDLEQLSSATSPETSVDQWLRTLCTRIFIEAEDLANSDFPLESRDLFMEQIGMCGQAGFVDQTQLPWLDSLLSWQASNGCFHQFRGENLAQSNFDPQRYGTYRRRKRAEKYMSPDRRGPEPCLAHRTSVALSALNSFLIRFVEHRYGMRPLRTDTGVESK